MKFAVIFAGVASVGFLSGCANVSSDPREGGFIGGIKGVVGGGYEERVQQEQDELDELRVLNEELSARLHQTHIEHSEVLDRIDALTTQVEEGKVLLELSQGLLDAISELKKMDSEEHDQLVLRQQELETLMFELTVATVELESQELNANEQSTLDQQTDGLSEKFLLLQETEAISADAAVEVKKHFQIIDSLYGMESKPIEASAK